MAFKFEKLNVWHKAVVLSEKVHQITSHFPHDELYVLTTQIKRAADSVSLNIAEGSIGQTNPEFIRSLGIAVRSAIEVVGCLFLAKRRRIISDTDFNTVYNMCEEIVVMINALRNTLQQKHQH
ncbi:MAG: four helix bundle protein [Chitinophagaceae bacterium]|nr:four helix bundle protein [Chitinophagaceae bacterium]